MRFLQPVYLGETVQVDYRMREVDPAAHKAFADMRASTPDGRLVLVGTHILYCYDEGEGEPKPQEGPQ